MLPLPPFIAAASLSASEFQTSPTPSSFSRFVTEASQRFGIPESWIYAVMAFESGRNSHAVSAKGAQGLMQIMPSTWRILRAEWDLGDDPFDPHDNIIAGAGYLRALYDRYGFEGFLAAYNAGPSRYDDFVKRGRPLPVETRKYVSTLMRSSAFINSGGEDLGPTPIPMSWSQSALFVAPQLEAKSTPRSPPFQSAAAPFAEVAATSIPQTPPSTAP
jgi:hypothetical protein